MEFKEKRLHEMRQKNQAFLFQQMAEKKAQHDEDQMLQKLHADIESAETKAFLDIEKERSRDRRTKNVQHRLELEKQISGRKPDKDVRDAMSQQESQMNH